MANVYTAGDANRLPWLTDEKKRRKKPAGWVVSFVAASSVAIIAAVSFWLGMNGTLRPQPASQSASEASLYLSEPELLQAEPMMPQVEPSPVPPSVALPGQEELRMEAPPVRRVAAKRAAAAAHRSRPKKLSASKTMAAEDEDALRYANPWKSTGVSGRMVRVGAYSSMEKGKDAWSRLAQLSPAIKQLPAVVTDIPSPTGRTLYWLQIGTTSQAHSEVLCQRMRAMGQRCVVVDLAGARKDSGNGRQSASL
jgi:hypothetical protein